MDLFRLTETGPPKRSDRLDLGEDSGELPDGL